ncbi:hypothetical protein Btru_064279 [Bulinus truncatus]|nr:hypothetical protein Btru_064279 [Bulinus truncatus]
MIHVIFNGDVSYLTWPDLNYFPLNDSQGEGLINRRFENFVSRIVIPVISAFGIVGNVISIAILIRRKLTKSSSWLILALAVADTFYLVGTNNIAMHLYTGGEEEAGFWYPEPQARALYYAYLVQLGMDLSGKVMSMMLPSLITCDRLVAVLTPFRYSRIMTVARVRVVILCLAVFSISVFIFYSLKFDFVFALGTKINGTSSSSSTTTVPGQRLAAATANRSDYSNNSENCGRVGMMVKSAFFKENYDFYSVTVKTVVFLYGPVPLLFTIIGCFVVGLQIRRQGKKFSSAAFVPTSRQNQGRLPFALSKFWKKILFADGKKDSQPGQITHSEAARTTAHEEQPRSKTNTGGDLAMDTGNGTCPTPSPIPAESVTPSDYHDNGLHHQGDRTFRNITGNGKNRGRTTRTLLSVCCVYCVANAINFLVLYIFTPNKVTFDTGVYVEMSRRSSGVGNPYFAWPDINYFPVTTTLEEEKFGRNFGKLMFWIVLPVTSVFGIAGNSLSILVLSKGRLNKSSSWLTLALAVADTVYLVATNNIPIHLYSNEEKFGFWYTESLAKALFYLYLLQKYAEIISKIFSMIVPCLITLDRLVAVLAPFRYRSVITLRRVRTAAVFFLVLSLAYAVFHSFKFHFKFDCATRSVFKNGSATFRQPGVVVGNISDANSINDANSDANENLADCKGLIAKSSFFINNIELNNEVVDIVVCLYSVVPLLVTVVGCFVIVVRIHNQDHIRIALLNKKSDKMCIDTFQSLVKNLCLKVKSRSGNCRINVACAEVLADSISTQVVVIGGIFACNEHRFPFVYSNIDEGASRAESIPTIFQPISQAEFGHNDVSRNINTATRQGPMPPVKAKHHTTRTLLSVCSVYCVASAINCLVLVFFNLDNVSSHTAIILEASRKYILVLNSACNFLFYVRLNKRYRRSYRDVFTTCLSRWARNK